MTALALAVGGFVTMEAVSYALHRWVMHGAGYGWHRSHHAPPTGRFERNDRFPLLFSVLGITLFALGRGPWPALWWLGVGVTAYGAAYLVVHELLIHRRLPVPVPRLRYFEWLREAHGDHHRAGGEPFGMLLPLVRRGAPRAAASDPLDRSSRRKTPAVGVDARDGAQPDSLDVDDSDRESTRSTRARL